MIKVIYTDPSSGTRIDITNDVTCKFNDVKIPQNEIKEYNRSMNYAKKLDELADDNDQTMETATDSFQSLSFKRIPREVLKEILKALSEVTIGFKTKTKEMRDKAKETRKKANERIKSHFKNHTTPSKDGNSDHNSKKSPVNSPGLSEIDSHHNGTYDGHIGDANLPVGNTKHV